MTQQFIDLCIMRGCSPLTHLPPHTHTHIHMSTQPIHTQLGLTQEQFIDLCIMCGCDYAHNIRGIGPVRALDYIRKHGSLEKVRGHIQCACTHRARVQTACTAQRWTTSASTAAWRK